MSKAIVTEGEVAKWLEVKFETWSDDRIHDLAFKLGWCEGAICQVLNEPGRLDDLRSEILEANK